MVENTALKRAPTASTRTTNIVYGTFANIQNNPRLQEVTFAPVSARSFASLRCMQSGERLDQRGGNFRRARRRKRGLTADFCTNPTPDSYMRKFNFSIFQPIIIAAALVLAGCASRPEIHPGWSPPLR